MLENYSRTHNIEHVAGLDEVGRGCFAGPVVTGAVILPANFEHELIRDSKKLSLNQRRKAYNIITDNAIAWSVQSGSVKYVNKYGINPATFHAMHKCLDDLKVKPTHLLVDGNVWDDYKGISYDLVAKGDNTYLSIAAASILAKVRRDDYMVMLSEHYPHYNFEGSKGYFCKKHGAGLLEHGMCDYHRPQYVNTWLSKQTL